LLSNSFYLQFVREVGKEFGNTFWPFSSSDEYNAKAFLSDGESGAASMPWCNIAVSSCFFPSLLLTETQMQFFF